MRDLVFLFFLISLIPFALSSTFVAFLLWTWAGLSAINSYIYGAIRSVPMVQIFAILTLLLLLLKPREASKEKYRVGLSGGWLIAILVHGFFCALFAYDGVYRNWELYTNMVKTGLLCLLMPLFLNTRDRINIYILLLAVSVCFHGMLDGLKYIASAGSHNGHGIAKFGDNNHYAIVLIMVMPMLIYVFKYAAHRLLKIASLGTFVLTFLAILATQSRGALLSFLAIGGWMIMQGKHKFAAVSMAVLLGFLTLQFAPDKWFERMNTIQAAQEDTSFMGRVTAWKRASAIALENPVFGAGYHGGQAPSIFEHFRHQQGLLGFVETPDFDYPKAAHSIYFEVLGDLGFVGLFLFLALLASVFVNRRAILKCSRAHPAELDWATDLSNLLAACMIAYIVGGAALSVAYFELPYYLMMLMQVLRFVVERTHSMEKPKTFKGASHA